jgi:hypothetical protein
VGPRLQSAFVKPALKPAPLSQAQTPLQLRRLFPSFSQQHKLEFTTRQAKLDWSRQSKSTTISTTNITGEVSMLVLLATKNAHDAI